MFNFTCHFFARQLVFPVPSDNNWPLQKTASGSTPWQTTSDSSKSLTEVVLSWIAFLNRPIKWEDGNAAVILCCDGHMLNFYFVSSHYSHLSALQPQRIQPVHPPWVPCQLPSHFSHPPPLSIPKAYTLCPTPSSSHITHHHCFFQSMQDYHTTTTAAANGLILSLDLLILFI